MIAAIGAVLLVLNIGLSDLLSFGTVRPSFTLPFVVYLALKRGCVYGTVAGFGLGLGEDLLGSTAAGSTALAFSIVGFVVGRVRRGGILRVHWPWGSLLILAAAFTELIRHLILARETGYGLWMLYLNSGAPSAVYTTALGILWFLSPLHRDRIQ